MFQFANLGGSTTELQLKNTPKVELIGVEASLRTMVTDSLGIGGNIGIVNYSSTMPSAGNRIVLAFVATATQYS